MDKNDRKIRLKKIGRRVALGLLLTPVALFLLLAALLYVPGVQNLLRRQAVQVASEATGLQVEVGRISLRFPLKLVVSDVMVLQPADSLSVSSPDTLLKVSRLNVHVQAWPLVRGRVEVDNISLERAVVHSGSLIPGIRLEGTLGLFSLQSHGVNLTKETATVNYVGLSDTHLQVILADTTAASPDTAATVPLRWKARLQQLRLENVSVDLSMPLDTLRLRAHIGQAELQDAYADLGKQAYGWRHFRLDAPSLAYDAALGRPKKGLDPSHLSLRNVAVQVDSAAYCGRDIRADIRQFSLDERSGLSVASLTGQLLSDSLRIRIPSLRLLTGHSSIDLSAQTYWQLVEKPTDGHLSLRLDARVGKQDILLLADSLPEAFARSFPSHPLVVKAGTEGNLTQMQISRFSIDLPGAFSLNGGGELWQVTDSLQRSAQMDFEMQTYDLSFLTELAGLAPDSTVIIPDSMRLTTRMALQGQACSAALRLQQQQGFLAATASYHLDTEAYQADLSIDSLDVSHFLPKDSLYGVALQVSARGRGLDVKSPATYADVRATLNQLQYGNLHFTGISLDGGLRSSMASVHLESDNPLLKMRTDASYHLNKPYTDARLDMDVAMIDLHRLGLLPDPLPHPVALTVKAETRRRKVQLEAMMGDVIFDFRARTSLEGLMAQGNHFVEELMRQVEEKQLTHAALRKLMPNMRMRLKGGHENPAADFLAGQGISYNDFKLNFNSTPKRGLNGRASLHGLCIDSLQLDTLFFAAHQDTTRLRLQSGVINGRDNPQIAFRSQLTGEVRNEDADLLLNYTDGEGRTGILFGLNARPILPIGRNRDEQGGGILLHLIPDKPVIAFRSFDFQEGKNRIYLHNNMRVYADVDMDSEEGMCFKMQSDSKDTLSLQNIHVELSRFNLGGLSDVLPYLPRLDGWLSAEAHYIQTEDDLQAAAEVNADSLRYEGRPVGNIGVGGAWIPTGHQRHLINAYLLHNHREVLNANGALTTGSNDLNLDIGFLSLPLKMANAFVPNGMARLSGELNGALSLSGTTSAPQIDGSLSMDTVSVYISELGARYWFDSRPLRIENNRLHFDKFALFTNSRNPFTIDGYVDFRNLNRPSADLQLLARQYTLLQAERTRRSLVYGKVDVDVMATVRGPLDALKMRGNMNLLGTTDVTYVLTDSPLTVEDRLSGLVTFVSFNDTTTVQPDSVPTVSLGGMDVLMTVHIDDAVRLRADLSTDRSKYIELEGGGDLALQYTPQGDMSLTGRYTLSGGTLKYSLPVIPLKAFRINSGSYVDWRGDLMDPSLDLKATERVRASVSDGGENSSSRMVNFDVSIAIRNRLSAPELVFDIAAPEDATVSNELQAMGAEERSKQAIAMLATGIYLNSGGKNGTGGLNMGTALNSVLQSQINALAGSAVKGASISVGVEDRTSAETGDTQTDYSFSYSQRFFNDRVQIVIGGKVSTGANATNSVESFIDNISLEYRLDNSGTRYIRAFHNKNYESVLDGEITETGVGLVLRRKMDKLSELFIFKRRKKPVAEPPAEKER